VQQEHGSEITAADLEEAMSIHGMGPVLAKKLFRHYTMVAETRTTTLPRGSICTQARPERRSSARTSSGNDGHVAKGQSPTRPANWTGDFARIEDRQARQC
jgi:hypothetical protein